MKTIIKAYTLIELIMVVSLLAVVLFGGTAIFYRSFRSSGLSDLQTSVNNGLRSLEQMLSRSLRFATVVGVTGSDGLKTRLDCLDAGVEGIVGDSLIAKDLAGGSMVYSLFGGEVSSNSAVISNPEIFVTNLQFTWYCTGGVNDKMDLLIEARTGTLSEVGSTGVLNKDIILLNSGINQ